MSIIVERSGLPLLILPAPDGTTVLSLDIINPRDPNASHVWLVGNDPNFFGYRSSGEIRYFYPNPDGSAHTGPIDFLHPLEIMDLLTTDNKRVNIIGL